MNFGTGTGNKYLGLRWLDGMANTGGNGPNGQTGFFIRVRVTAWTATTTRRPWVELPDGYSRPEQITVIDDDTIVVTGATDDGSVYLEFVDV